MFGLRPAAEPQKILSAREIDVVRELVWLLAFAGEYFTEVAGGAHLLASLRLEGFRDARSQVTIEGSSTGDLEAALRPGAPNGLTQSARGSARDLRDTPERAARVLIERWLPAFYTDPRDLFTLVLPGANRTD